MRSYLIDELDPNHIARLRKNLADKGFSGSLDDVFWLPVPPELLSVEQRSHKERCGPHCMALELGENWISLELLVRAINNLHCSCIAYADPAQREQVINFVDRLLRELDIPV